MERVVQANGAGMYAVNDDVFDDAATRSRRGSRSDEVNNEGQVERSTKERYPSVSWVN